MANCTSVQWLDSCLAVVKQSLDSYKAVARKYVGSKQAVGGQSSGSWCGVIGKLLLVGQSSGS